MNKLSKILMKLATEYNNMVLSEQLQDISTELQNEENNDDTKQGGYDEFVKAVQKPTRFNFNKLEKSMSKPAPKAKGK